MRQLTQAALGLRIAVDAVGRGPRITGQMLGAEDAVQHRQVHGKILVHRRRRVMPVMAARRRNHPVDPAETDAHDGVDEHGME